MKECESHGEHCSLGIQHARKKQYSLFFCKLLLLLRFKLNGKKLNITCWFMICLGGRHLETQTNHVYVFGLHYQSEHIWAG